MSAGQALMEVFGQTAADPVPLGTRLGDIVYAARIGGVDPATGQLAGGFTNQVEQALVNLRVWVEQASGTLDNVARVTAYVSRLEDREPFYGPWETLFAPPRPACKVLVDALPDGQLVSLQALAVPGGTRERIDVPGVPARDPTITIGNLVLTSRVHGTDPATGKIPDDAEDEARLALSHVRQLAEIGGGSARDISQITVFVRDAQHLELARRHFEAAFPDAEHRPRYQVMEAFISPTMRLIVEMMAVKGAEVREPLVELLVPWVSGVMPTAVKVGQVILGSNIRGVERQSRRLPNGFESQLRCAFEVMRATLEQAGASLAHVAQVTVFMRDLDLKPTLNAVWTDLFPEPNDRPPHKYVPVDLPPGQEVLLNFVAVAGGVRKVLEIPGMVHVDPMSMGAVVDRWLFSSRIVGTDTRTGKTDGDAGRQAELALENVRMLLRQAGADASALTQVTAFVTGAENLHALDTPWQLMFPDGGPRPDLHVIPTHLPGNAYVRLEVKGTV